MGLRNVLHNSLLLPRLILLLYKSCAILLLAKENFWALYSICLLLARLLSRIIPRYFASRPSSTEESLSLNGGGTERFLEKSTWDLSGLSLILRVPVNEYAYRLYFFCESWWQYRPPIFQGFYQSLFSKPQFSKPKIFLVFIYNICNRYSLGSVLTDLKICKENVCIGKLVEKKGLW